MRLTMTIATIALALASCSRGARDDAADPAAAIADEETTDSLAAPDEAPAVKLYALECGRFDVLDLSVFDINGAYDGRTDKFADGCFLVRHPDGDLLWDAGLPDSLAAQPDGAADGAFHVAMPKTLKGQLAGIGVQPEDIEFFSISHSHYDHVGNANDYAGATWLVQRAERAYMFRSEARADARSFAAYSALESAESIQFKGDYDVFGDSSVTIVGTPGHTPGHSSLLVKLKNSGPVLLSGDLYHLAEARVKRTVPTFNTDPEETLRSMDKFEALAARTGARVVIQHEDEDFDALPAPPAYLD